jgi:hypothetical protein
MTSEIVGVVYAPCMYMEQFLPEVGYCVGPRGE